MSPSRAARREDVERRIVEIGRRHLVEHGATGLSLRAVTRELGMVSSAVYRYVANRDELLTLLVVDAYTDLADAVDAAVHAASDRPWDERIVVAGSAFRAWAADDPSRYALLYGSPVPGYEAPAERTMEPGTRVPFALARLVAEGVAAGEVTGAGLPPVTDERLAVDLAAVADELGVRAEAEVTAWALLVWSTVVGTTSLEVFGQYGRDAFIDPGSLVAHQLRSVLTLATAAPA